MTDSLKQSVTVTVRDIEEQVRRESYEIVNIIEDFKTQRSPAAKEMHHPQSPLQQLLLGQFKQKQSSRSTVSSRASSYGWSWPQA